MLRMEDEPDRTRHVTGRPQSIPHFWHATDFIDDFDNSPCISPTYDELLFSFLELTRGLRRCISGIDVREHCHRIN